MWADWGDTHKWRHSRRWWTSGKINCAFRKCHESSRALGQRRISSTTLRWKRGNLEQNLCVNLNTSQSAELVFHLLCTLFLFIPSFDMSPNFYCFFVHVITIWRLENNGKPVSASSFLLEYLHKVILKQQTYQIHKMQIKTRTQMFFCQHLFFNPLILTLLHIYIYIQEKENSTSSDYEMLNMTSYNLISWMKDEGYRWHGVLNLVY